MASDPVKEWLLTAHPNPKRVGCFPPQVLHDFVDKLLPANHPVVDHLDNCSPCYQEVSILLEARRVVERQKNERLLKLAGSAAIVVVLAGSWFGTTHYLGWSFTPNRQPTPLGVINFSTASNRGQGEVVKDQIISRNIRAVTIIVPFRDQPGLYDVELRRASDDQVVLRFTGTVSQDNKSGINTLRSAVSFAQLTPGWYQMLWYRQGSSVAEVGEFRIQ